MGVKTFGKGKSGLDARSSLEHALQVLEKAGEDHNDTSSMKSTTPLAPVGAGLPALPKKTIQKIEANEYVDFNELPPAKGKGRSISQTLEGQIVVVQAADLMQARKTIPDLATWSQCFSLYTAVVAKKSPGRVPELMAYLTIITKASQKYKWPSWVIYDQNFRLEAAGNPTQAWSKVDPSIYAQCFTGQTLCSENWCARCQSLEHPSHRCPLRPSKRSWSSAFGQGQGPPKQDQAQSAPACIKFNKYNGDCKFGKQCRYQHICSECSGPHPLSKCNKKDTTLKESCYHRSILFLTLTTKY